MLLEGTRFRASFALHVLSLDLVRVVVSGITSVLLVPGGIDWVWQSRIHRETVLDRAEGDVGACQRDGGESTTVAVYY